LSFSGFNLNHCTAPELGWSTRKELYAGAGACPDRPEFLKEKTMAVSGVGGTQTSDNSIKTMTEAFDKAIEKSAEITKITTEKKVALDAAKQRPNG
jgi:hypothetical protein